MPFKFARSNRIVVGMIMLVVSMMYGPQAHAATVFYDLTYAPFSPTQDNIFVDITASFDDTNITGVGQEFIPLESISFTITAPNVSGVGSDTASTDSTAQITFPTPPTGQVGPFFIPLTGQFNAGVFNGQILGSQPAAGSSPFIGVYLIGFSNNPINKVAFRFFGNNIFGYFNSDNGFAQFQNVSDPYSQNLNTIPVPAALPLLLTSLFALGVMGWRRRKAS